MVSRVSTTIINISYLILHILIIVVLITKKQYLSMLESIFVIIPYLLFLFYERKKGTVLTNFIRISVLISLLSNDFFGDYLGFYNTSVYFDKILHLFGTFAFSVFIYSIAEKRGHFIGIGKVFIFIWVLFFGSFLGTMFEIGEFICDQIFKTLNQSNLMDTNIDMICNTIGAAAAGIFVVYGKHLPKHT